MADDDFQVLGTNANALFTLKVHRSEGFALLAMNWKGAHPPDDFAGFAIEYAEPGSAQFFPLNNRLTFPGVDRSDPKNFSTLRSPIQMFRWVHFPRNAEKNGLFEYRVTPVFMGAGGALTTGAAQTAKIALRRETYPGQMNVTFTRGFVSSQAFVDKYGPPSAFTTLIPGSAARGLDFAPTHAKAAEAFAWMGFEARSAILEVLDRAIADPTAQVRVVAYDLNLPDLVTRLEQLGERLKVIIDDSDDHRPATAAETHAESRLKASAGAANVRRQHMGGLQHNKFIAVDGQVKVVVCGSTNFSWRGFFVQSNNAVILTGSPALQPFLDAFEQYWQGSAAGFRNGPPAHWTSLGLAGIDAQVAFSPHDGSNSVLNSLADDIRKTESSLFYSLAFLYQTPGLVRNAIGAVTRKPEKFVYGISDKSVGGLSVHLPGGRVAPVYPAALSTNVPAPFKTEPAGGSGARMHHKFVVIDFDRPTARVYLGSYNFSKAADADNGENLLVIRDRRIATSYMVEALRMFDHYYFRVLSSTAKGSKLKRLDLRPAPQNAGDVPWWRKNYDDPRRAQDRVLFA